MRNSRAATIMFLALAVPAAFAPAGRAQDRPEQFRIEDCSNPRPGLFLFNQADLQFCRTRLGIESSDGQEEDSGPAAAGPEESSGNQPGGGAVVVN